jgi:hypothetical protein
MSVSPDCVVVLNVTKSVILRLSRARVNLQPKKSILKAVGNERYVTEVHSFGGCPGGYQEKTHGAISFSNCRQLSSSRYAAFIGLG